MVRPIKNRKEENFNMFCIPKNLIAEFNKRKENFEITVAKLSKMSPKERHDYFVKFLGEDIGKQTNALIESKLILKDQQKGLETAIKQLLGNKPDVQRDMLSRVQRLEKLLQPKEMDAFLNDLVSKKLGIEISVETAGKLMELAKITMERKEKLMTGKGDRIEYGAAKVAFFNYYNKLKLVAEHKTTMESIKDPVKFMTDLAGTAKAMKASMDNSAIFRQGWKTMMTHPGIWWKSAIKSFSDIFKTLKGEEVIDRVNADILSRPRAVDGSYAKGKFDIGTIEEAYPTLWARKLPVIGRLYHASEVAYTAFLHRLRADLADKYLEIAERTGVDITNVTELQNIGKLVNSLTGRGSLGRAEPMAGIVNNIFFSPRLLKSNWDILTAHQFQRGVTPFVRKQAAINLLKIVSGSAAILVIADAINPGSVQKDPRSADFGKIRVGDTKFDVSGGMSGLVTLASRIMTNASKSSTTGMITSLGNGDYGSQTRLDVIYNFFENKLSPAFAVIKDLMKGETFSGDKPTVMNELNNLVTPIIVTNYFELQSNPNSANVLMSQILDGLGISVNTYSVSKADWSRTMGKELEAFQKRVGEEKFKEANGKFNELFNQWFTNVGQDIRYQSLPQEDQKKVINNKKDDLKQSVFRSYGFRYKQAPAKKLPKF
jgi:hypothetical protein